MSGPYCASCGQKKRDTNLTLREFLHEATRARELGRQDPEHAQDPVLQARCPHGRLSGRPARLLSPLRLYLICSLAFFVSKPIAEAISNRSFRSIATISITNPDGSTSLTPEGLEELEAGLPARIFGRDRLLRAVANLEQWNREVNAVLPKAMFILLPMFAFLTMLAWRRRLPRYPAHLYLALHLHRRGSAR